MKQFVIIIHLFIISIATICAQQVTRDEAVTAAINNLKYYYQNQNISRIDSVYSYCRNGRTLIYEVHFDTDELFYNGGNNQNYTLQRDAMNATYCDNNCETSAYINMIPSALKKIRFNEAYMYTESAAGNHATWVNMLIQELVNSRPVFYAAYDYSVTPHRGHGFVCDGYYKDANDHDYFNFNWGWNGDYNSGYFTLPYLNPGTHNYPDAHKAIFNIQPSNCWENIIFSCDKYFIHQNQTLHAENAIKNNYHIFSVMHDSRVVLKAGEEIVLTDGFCAGNGDVFVAKIEACEPDDGDGMPNLTEIGERNLSGGRTDDGRTRCVPTDNGLVIYPNPAGGTLTVESAIPIREITVYDLSGRVMMTANGGIVETCHGASLQMDVSSLQGGIYLLRVVTTSGVETGRFVKN